ncbi:unnamed protein product [Ectocarpus sp. 13 AM-2016]
MIKSKRSVPRKRFSDVGQRSTGTGRHQARRGNLLRRVLRLGAPRRWWVRPIPLMMEASAHEPSIAEGYLTKKTGVQWKRCWFVLDDDVMTYYSSARGNLISEGRLVLDGKSTVIHLTIPANAFQVVASNATVLKVYADTKEERDCWFTAVNKRINQRMKEGGPPRRRRQNTRSVVSGGNTFELDFRYDLIKPYGGRGVRALDRQSNKKVLISKYRGAFDDLAEAKGIARDICIMRNLDHENILKVVDVLPPPSVEDFDDVYIVSELMETDLHRVIYSRQHLTNEHTQYFLYQILCAVKYIHSASLVHQGLRPSRVMLNANCDLKISDFELSRGAQSEHNTAGLPFLSEIMTQWYCAPEILLAAQVYDESVDLWSAGCIFAEMLRRRPLFVGLDHIGVLTGISSLIGKPTEPDLWFVTNPRAKRCMLVLPDSPPSNLGVEFPTASSDAVDLLSRMLVLDPNERISAEEALEHPYLAELHDVSSEPTAEIPVDIKPIEAVELTKHNLRSLILEDVLHFHPECEDLIQPTLAVAGAAAAKSVPDGDGSRSS